MLIRDALVEEFPLIREQRVRAYEVHVKNIPEDHWKALKAAISSDANFNSDIERIVAELDGKIIGSVVLYPAHSDAYEGNVEQLDYPEIRMLAVDPEAQGRGIATALISECIERAKAKGHLAIGLHTGAFMKSAISLYERFGFEHISQYDFEPANDGIIVKAYRLNFEKIPNL
ncbi:GNAT family N-acetyltransferase [Neobacillus cucumis]|uniref:GNAT family N-acetyltransferase n=1 Tax=Neobacillus cucumis TaxID=1740721 RepID=UPI001963A5D6|nr:GNAT family N-acetyltransferase [Neobacillus cucumis]MBM7650858.1 GNAT superfamily N-acetyltransferase [Neobacillus cucumis]